MIFLSGIVLFFLGVIGEYVGRIYEETKGRPQYIIGRVAGRTGAGTGDRASEISAGERTRDR